MREHDASDRSMPRRATLFAAALSVCLAATTEAREGALPQETWAGEREADAYCGFVTESANGERALLRAPEFFSTTATTGYGDNDTGTNDFLADTSLRQTVGLRVSANRLYRAHLVADRSRADCDLYRTRARLARALAFGRDLGLFEALTAERGVLLGSLRQGEDRVTSLRREIGARTATQQELLAWELRLGNLRNRLEQIEEERDRVRTLPDGFPEGLRNLMTDFRAADAAGAEAEIALREAKVWDVEVRSGFDQILDEPRDVPVFATVTVSLNLGFLQQQSANDRALLKRAEWRRREFSGLERQWNRLIDDLASARRHAHDRMARVSDLRADLRGRLEEIANVSGDFASRHRDVLWYEGAQLDAEFAYLDRRIARIDAFLVAAGAGHELQPLLAPAPTGPTRAPTAPVAAPPLSGTSDDTPGPAAAPPTTDPPLDTRPH
jgi:hypothetical protein